MTDAAVEEVKSALVAPSYEITEEMVEDAISPDEFLERMRKARQGYDWSQAIIEMADLLESLGYEEGIAEFDMRVVDLECL